MKYIKYILITLFFLSINNVYALEDTCEYSSEYLKYLALSEDSKKNVSTPDMCKKSEETLMRESINNTLNKNTSLPSYFNLVDEKRVTPVKNQMSTGTCWTFGTNANIESFMLTKYKLNYDLSERHMEYATSRTFKDGINKLGFNREVDDGGIYNIPFGYLMSHLGPVSETDMPFEDNTDLINLNDIKKKVVLDVNGIMHFGNVKCSNISNEIKEYIYNNGAITTSIYWSNTNYVNRTIKNNKYMYSLYYPGSNYSNHTVAIVGWDDNYSKDNFLSTYKPNNNGAWIVRNSWGSSWGNGGYFYISYEDKRVCESLEGVTSVETELDDNFYTHTTYAINSAIYQTSEGYGATIYEKKNKYEYLKEVSIGSYYDNDVEVYVIDNVVDSSDLDIENATKVGEGKLKYRGYNTIKLEEPYLLTGDKFGIIVKYKGTNEFLIGIVKYDSYLNKYVEPNSGETFISKDGKRFIDGTTASYVDFYVPINAETSTIERSITLESTDYDDVIDNTIDSEFYLLYKVEGINNNSNINYQVIDSNNNDVTSNFTITGNKVVNKKIRLNVSVPADTNAGEYTLIIEYEGFKEEFKFSMYQAQKISIQKLTEKNIFNKKNSTFDLKVVYTLPTEDETIVKIYKGNSDVSSNFSYTKDNNVYTFKLKNNIISGKYTVKFKVDNKESSIDIDILDGTLSSLSFTKDKEIVKKGTINNFSYSMNSEYNELVNIESSNENVVKINNDGTFTALTKGTSTITISYIYDNNIKDTMTIEVIDMKLLLDNIEIDKGSYDKLYNKYGGIITGDIISQDVTDVEITINNSNLERVNSINVVNDNNEFTLTIPPNTKAGTYCLSVNGEYKNNSDVIGVMTTEYCFNVEEYILIQSIEVSDITLYEKDVTSLMVSITPEAAINQDLIYESLDTDIVTVDMYGTISAIKKGNTSIVIKNELSGISKTIKVEVKDIVLKNKKVTLDDNNINYFLVGNNVKKIKDTLDIQDIKVYNQSNVLKNDNDLVGTGYYIYIPSVDRRYYLVVKGDLNGDTKINSADLLEMRLHLLGTRILTGPYKDAAYIFNGTTINSGNLLILRQHLLGISLIK